MGLVPDKFFVRANSLKMLAAFYAAVRERGELDDYRAFGNRFFDDALGIILSHEETEVGLVNGEGLTGLNSVQVEVFVEKNSFPKLLERGIPPESYQLFHKLRRYRGENISDLIALDL